MDNDIVTMYKLANELKNCVAEKYLVKNSEKFSKKLNIPKEHISFNYFCICLERIMKKESNNEVIQVTRPTDDIKSDDIKSDDIKSEEITPERQMIMDALILNKKVQKILKHYKIKCDYYVSPTTMCAEIFENVNNNEKFRVLELTPGLKNVSFIFEKDKIEKMYNKINQDKTKKSC